jgi:predicted nuclease of restriction endonuclease-like (RecB) superfamily
MLLGIGDVRQRRFYFEQACHQRWSKRELQRQIAGALFERVSDLPALCPVLRPRR